MDSSILIRRDGKAGRLTLNRPNAKHALDQEMCGAMIKALQTWRSDPNVELVLIDHHQGSPGFCVGGDLKRLSESGRSFGDDARTYFQRASHLVSLIATFPKPCITIMNGDVKGMANGIAANSAFQIATERTALSFPETSYGFVPGGGATLTLSRLPNEVGTWLALTGAKLRGAEVVDTSLATHFCTTRDLEDLKQALAIQGSSVLNDYKQTGAFSLETEPAELEYLFSGDCAFSINTRLQRGSGWAKRQATKLSAKSPLATKIALRQLRTGRYLDSVIEALKIEYRIISRLVCSQNFLEGVRAAYIDMDYCPNWRPNRLRSVSFDMVAKYFAPLPNPRQELRLSPTKTCLS